MMSNIQTIYEQYKVLPQSSKNELLELINQEKINKEQKRQQRLRAIEETEPFFEQIRMGLPSDYQFDRDFANER
jgi:hypothetical protein